MKFKAYGWSSVWRDNSGESSSWAIDVLPTITLDYWRHDWDAYEERGIEETHVRYFYIMFSWLFFGVTFDFRFGEEER